MKGRKREKLDGIDVENISQVVDSRGWQLIRQRVEKTRDDKMRELLQPLDPVATSNLRGFVAGLELALKVPQILMGEVKDGISEDK